MLRGFKNFLMQGDLIVIAVGCVHSRERPDLPSWILIQMHDHVGTLGGEVGYSDEGGGWRIDAVVPWSAPVALSPR